MKLITSTVKETQVTRIKPEEEHNIANYIPLNIAYIMIIFISICCSALNHRFMGTFFSNRSI
jgi:hypothetical protein